ncbi:hypothetical protein Tsubulata_039281 [Turnera subulata]|uniref:NB-ARC domain-containing protein n=1 Tax=Turnera subulata TaxID=218843 RepID=A0A9Q0JQW3_9ROSI|nr:hypothetical protein Tsubulata_039281 [Turnera subulata]
MGGSGKTTLIAKTYNCEIVKRHFECSAWITVSQTYSIEDLFRSFIRQFYEAAKQAIPLDLITMSYRQLVEMLVNYLDRKRYLVVLDDVWDTELWNNIKVALPNSQHGCRVIITTRMDDIAAKSFEVGSDIHHIKPMEENEAWTLFCMKAFPWNARRCPEELENLAKDVVEKCQGLPLAVVSLGGKCKMHDMLRELALSKAEEEKFCALYDEQIGARREEGAIRRLSIQGSQAEIKLWEGMTQLRSFLLFVSETIDSTMINKFLSGFKLLRVLDLKGAPIDTFPDHVVSLFNLRYLNLKRTRIKKLPESVGRLFNLETLDLRRSQVEALPNGIVNLKTLQYLLSYQLKDGTYLDFNSVIGTRFPPKLNTLNNLQVLGYVEANSIVVKEIKSMTQLVRLDITDVEGSHEEDLCFAIQNMRLLRRLYVKAAKEDQILCLDALKSPPPFLEKLILFGKLDNIPQWFKSLQNLRQLSLSWSRLAIDPLSHIEALPNLRRLFLNKVHEEQHLEFKNGFRSLEILGIYYCDNLQSLTIDKGVMPGLKKLGIGSCGMLKEVPSGLKYLTKLQELWLINLSEDLIKRIEEPSGVDRPNVHHIPKITHYNKTSSGRSIRNLSSFVDTTGFFLSSQSVALEMGARAEEGAIRRLSIQSSHAEIKPWEELDLRGAPIETFPDHVVTLFNLSTVVKEIGSMTQLVSLDITNIEGSHEDDMCFAIQNMRLLRRLSVKAAKEDGMLCLDALKSPPLFLEFLALVALLNLRRLELGQVYDELHLEFKNGFRSLQILVIYYCDNLQSIMIDKGVMPGIKFLEIGYCGMLKEVSSGIKYLAKLQELLLTNLSEDLIKRIEEPSSVDRPNVQHIPKITYQYKTSSGWST